MKKNPSSRFLTPVEAFNRIRHNSVNDEILDEQAMKGSDALSRLSDLEDPTCNRYFNLK